MQPRIKNPAMTVPGALEALRALGFSATQAGIPEATIQLVELRASQINGCSICADMHSRALEQLGERPERIHLVAAWREAPYFDEAERAALELAEAVTRIADRPGAVSDEIWAQAARHYSEDQLASLVVALATINAFNRVNAATRQITGEWVARFVETDGARSPEVAQVA
jgi:AhpD family alkylhydroperoxidase